MSKEQYESTSLQDEQIKKIYDIAKSLAVPKDINDNISCASVGAAVLAKSGNIYKGVCIDMACSLGMCAERNALSTMIKNGETDVDTVIAVNRSGRVMPPCGACREFMWQLNNSGDIKVVVDNEGTVVKLKDLMPYPY